MKTYSNYKDSEIEWIGEIPSHWVKSRLAYNGRFFKGKGVSKTDLSVEGLPVMLYGDIYTKYNIKTEKLERFIPNDLAQNTFPIIKGDLLFAASGETPDEIGKCICYLGKKNAYVGGDVIVLRQNKNHSVFLSYLFNSYKVNEQKAKLSKGEIVVHIYSGQLRDIQFPLPPPTEQTAIASYLDRKTSEIDELIADKKRLLELYEEEKTAIINELVTGKKVWDGNAWAEPAKVKDSGIEWLGEIPEHWEVKRLRYIARITTGAKDTENREDDGEYPFYVRSQTVERISTYSFDGEGILTAGDGVGVCKVWHYVNGKFDFHQRVYLIYDFQEITGKLLFYYIKHNFIHDVLKLSAKSTVDSLRRNMFLEFKVAFPKTSKEQQSIVHHIETECKRINTQIERTKKLIDLLTEYRTALISEVVTGKIKVTE